MIKEVNPRNKINIRSIKKKKKKFIGQLKLNGLMIIIYDR